MKTFDVKVILFFTLSLPIAFRKGVFHFSNRLLKASRCSFTFRSWQSFLHYDMFSVGLEKCCNPNFLKWVIKFMVTFLQQLIKPHRLRIVRAVLYILTWGYSQKFEPYPSSAFSTCSHKQKHLWKVLPFSHHGLPVLNYPEQ